MPNVATTVFDIANWFLARAKEENRPLKHMKLQKLVYFAYGWHYAYFDEQLFQEKIYAWPHGPVVEDLYHQYKHCGGREIDVDIAECPALDKHAHWVVDQVWNNFSRYSDVELSKITHRPESPWYQVYDSSERDTEIPPELIRDYFKGLREKYENVKS